MNNLNKLKLSTEIVFEFVKSEYYHGEATMEKDLLDFMRNDERYKNLVD